MNEQSFPLWVSMPVIRNIVIIASANRPEILNKDTPFFRKLIARLRKQLVVDRGVEGNINLLVICNGVSRRDMLA